MFFFWIRFSFTWIKLSEAASHVTSKSESKSSDTLFAPSTTKDCSCFRYFFTCRDLTNFILALVTIFQSFIKRASSWCLFVIVAAFMSSCIGTKHLQENEKLLYHQNIKYPKKFNSEGLRDLYVQKVNGRIRPTSISIPVGMYYAGKKKFDKEKFIERKTKVEAKYDRKIAAAKKQKKIANLQYRKQNATDVLNKKIENGNMFMQWGEPVTIFDTAAMHQTKNKIESTLFNRGYFKVKVKADSALLKKKRIAVTYTIVPGPAFFYDTLFYNIPDANVSN